MEEKESLELSAKTVDEAIELAMLELGADPAEVEIDVISRGRIGILGIGSEQARVRVRRITGDGGTAATAISILDRVLSEMDAEVRPTIRSSGSGPDDPPVIDLQGEDAGLIIGHRGETLQALQFLVNVMLSQQLGERTHVVVDVEQYRERRQRNLDTLARRMAERATSSGRTVAMEPMSAADRRLVHMCLADSTAVTTESEGEGRDRHVTIIPTGPATGDHRSSPEGPSRGGRRGDRGR